MTVFGWQPPNRCQCQWLLFHLVNLKSTFHDALFVKQRPDSSHFTVKAWKFPTALKGGKKRGLDTATTCKHQMLTATLTRISSRRDLVWKSSEHNQLLNATAAVHATFSTESLRSGSQSLKTVNSSRRQSNKLWRRTKPARLADVQFAERSTEASELVHRLHCQMLPRWQVANRKFIRDVVTFRFTQQLSHLKIIISHQQRHSNRHQGDGGQTEGPISKEPEAAKTTAHEIMFLRSNVPRDFLKSWKYLCSFLALIKNSP